LVVTPDLACIRGDSQHPFFEDGESWQRVLAVVSDSPVNAQLRRDKVIDAQGTKPLHGVVEGADLTPAQRPEHGDPALVLQPIEKLGQLSSVG
jgi:hypothetical protein